MNKSEYFNNNGWFKEEYLWNLRQEITLGSLCYSDYRNTFGVDEHKVSDFFDDFLEFMEECAQEDNLWDEAVRRAQINIEDGLYETSNQAIKNAQQDAYEALKRENYDNERYLKEHYGRYCYKCPLPPNIVNVDIYLQFHRSIQVIAGDEYEAEEIVNEMMNNHEIPVNSFEPDDDWYLDTSYQP